jgi:HlyD family secretion protein
MEADAAAADLAIAERELEVARAALANARAQLAYDQVVLDHHTLKAPFDGVVAERRRELGSVLVPGEILFTIVDPASVWVLAHVDEARAGDIRVGQPASVHLRSYPGRVFQGVVARIGIESDRISEERRVYVACSDCPEAFHLGEQAEIVVRTGTIEEGLLVPEAAVEHPREGAGTVWVIDQGQLSRREVSLGRRTLDGRYEITAGLAENTRVLVVLPALLREGRAARAVEGSGS